MSLKKKIREISPDWLVNFYHLARGVVAATLYGFPGRKLRVIGITGTNGKTTTAHLIASVLQSGGRKVGMCTTVDFQIGEKVIENNLKMTTVSPFLLQKLLSQMVRAGCQDAVIEVTSIGLDQHRLWGIPFQVAVFTNLTHDHLDYHQTMEKYRQAKEELFSHRPALSVINIDDPAAEHFLKHSANRTVTYSLKSNADLVGKKIYQRAGGTDFVLLARGHQASISIPMPGEFNVANALAAAGVGLGLGLSLEEVVEGLRVVQPVPGRMEVIDCGQAFTAIVDYAHTPDALQKVYETIKPAVHGKMISVLGATGQRDKTKRPILGALAGQFADYVIVTNEDPYDEDPNTIIDEVAAGVPRGRPLRGRYKVKKASEEEGDLSFKYKDNGEDIWWWRVPDRKEAIAKALTMARPQDVVLVTGKGAEKVMAVGDKLVPFSDRQVLEELLQKYRV
ncbi:MAG: UDP-N-acetylmuramoyl-L-alanyl-D-glutamate--2,6-diaminopimelate ligase [bacterium]|nr:UDP-N-acetylmuramoyl-L-alanyl-D-glutamate--2,6-diaminopimelate ligase [bacterium]